MSTDDSPESLAAQAAAWVPPWERPRAAAEASPPASGDGEPGEVPAVPELPAERVEQTSPAVDPPLRGPRENAADPIDPDTREPAAVPAQGREPAAVPAQGREPAAVPAQGREPASVPAQGRESAAVLAQGADVTPTSERDKAVAENGTGGPVRVDHDASATDPGGDPDRDASADPARVVDDHELRAALEAILLVVDEPVAEMVLAQILEQPTERVAAMLEAVSAGYTAAGHGFDLRRAAGGWRLYTRPEYAAYVERFVLDGQSLRLTQAALETLAVIAYKQPVSRSRISAIRGVNCDGVMRTLVSRGLVEECGTEQESGAFLYRTTVLFLEKLGLNSVDQLPPLAPFLPDDVEEVLDAQR